MIVAETRSKGELEPAFNSLRAAGVPLAIILRDNMFVSERRHIADLAMAVRLPTIASQNSYVEAGGLISYGVEDSENHRRAADFVDKILKGAKPTDLPVEFPTKLLLVINTKTAPGTQPVSLNISLAISRRALTSLVVALLMIILVSVH